VRTLPSVELLEMALARADRWQLLDHIFAELAEGRGGWLVTANLDFLRRHMRDPQMRQLYAGADVRVADGMPLVWAAWLQGDPLPERVAGSSLLKLLAARAAREGRSVYLLGGAGDSAPRAAEVLCANHSGLRIAGYSSPRVSEPASPAELGPIVAELERTCPDLLLVGLGSPKQERLIEQLRVRFPAIWMMGVGISFSFIAGDVARAPYWMRLGGLEWVHRLAQEPNRLARRYLVEDLPFAIELFGRAALRRLGSR
jgi:N-acetylglucosaminyldiphosphoundecaprenol N-acetyl-beta-D-mannosaminyltransferase